MNLDPGDFPTINIIVALPDRSRVSAQSGWMRVKHIVDQLMETPRIAAVRSIVSANRDAKPWEQIGALPSQFLDTFVSTDRTKALAVVIPRADAQTFELSQPVRDIRPIMPGLQIAALLSPSEVCRLSMPTMKILFAAAL